MDNERIECTICDNGIVVNFHRKSLPVNHKRGRVTGFTKSSAARLREFLARAHLSGASLVGLTLTVPFSVEEGDDLAGLCSNYRVWFNRFTLRFRRDFPDSAAVFRHELQRRGMPHTHLVCWVKDCVAEVFGAKCLGHWLQSLPPTIRVSKLESFLKYGVKCEKLDGNFASFRYLAAHSSKHKSSQLGYQGKQWGVINSKVLSTEADTYLVDRRAAVLVQRYLRKISYFSREKDCVFGSVKVRSKKNCSVRFVSPDTRKKIFALVEKSC